MNSDYRCILGSFRDGGMHGKRGNGSGRFELIDARDEEMEVETDVMLSGEEFVGMEELSICETKEREDVEAICSSNDVKRTGGV